MQEPVKTSTVESEDSLRCLIVYEDVPTQRRALDMYNYLATRFGGDLGLEFSWWSLALLRDARRAREATLAATSADLVIFSVYPGADWSAEIKAWIENWALLRLNQPGAIGVILTPVLAQTVTLTDRQCYLREVAARNGMDFLAANVGPTLLANRGSGPGELREGNTPIPESGTDFLERLDTSSHWGIND